MNQKIRAAENAIDVAQNQMLEAIKETFPIGKEVKAHGPRDPLKCVVEGYISFETIQLKVIKSGATMGRKYTSLEV